MTKEELAKKLDGKEYRSEIPDALVKDAKANGLVIVYGHSDDLIEFEGAIHDEGGCYDGGSFLIDRKGLIPDRDDIDEDDELEAWLKRKKKAKKIEAIWCDPNEPAWTYKTLIPHATFNVIEGDGDTEVQCRGIVFSINDF